MTNVKNKKRLFLVDASGYIFRAYYALPSMSRADGTPINAVFGFSKMLMKFIEDILLNQEENFFGVVLDAGRITFRNEIYPDYKANRDETPEDLIPQFNLIKESIKAFNVPFVERKGFEADDLIATYCQIAKQEGLTVRIISADKDLMQLVGNGVEMFDPMKQKIIGVDQVVEKFGVPPEKVIDVQALAGDSVDNVPGVPGIGIKTASELINKYNYMFSQTRITPREILCSQYNIYIYICDTYLI